MKHTLLSFTAVVAGFFMLPAVAHSQQSTKSVGDNNLYAFATIGQASHDANLDSSVSSGSLSLTRSTDDEGTAITLGVGLQQSDKIAFEFMAVPLMGLVLQPPLPPQMQLLMATPSTAHSR